VTVALARPTEDTEEWMADYPDDPIGILAEVLPELRKTLAGCAAFTSHEALAAIFVDPRLHPWQQRLPQVPSVEQRVNQVIALLHHEENEQGENALVLLLHVLKEHEPTRRATLTRLRYEHDHLIAPPWLLPIVETPSSYQMEKSKHESYARPHWYPTHHPL
jgi:hypothetical protein